MCAPRPSLVAQPDTALVLTTHSAREAAAVCTRVAVLAQGRLLALGAPEELQRRYGAGHTLLATSMPGAEAALRAHLVAHLPPEAIITAAEPHLVDGAAPDDCGSLRCVLPPTCRAPLAALAAALEGAPVCRWDLIAHSLGAAVADIVGRATAGDNGSTDEVLAW